MRISLARFDQDLVVLGRDAHDLPGAKLVLVGVAELAVGERLEGHAVAVGVLAYEHGQATHLVARRDELAPIGHDEQGEGSLDLPLRVLDAAHEVALRVDQGGHQLGHVHLTRAHGHELVADPRERLDELGGVVDRPDGGEREEAEVRADEQWLRVGVADAAHPHGSGEDGEVLLELGAEGRVLDGVDLALEARAFVPDDHAGAPRPEVGVVVHAKEHVKNHVAARRRPKEGSHQVRSPPHPLAGRLPPPGMPVYRASIRVRRSRHARLGKFAQST